MKKKGELWNYHIMMLPASVMLFVFHIIPIFGIVIAFQNFIPGVSIWHQQWVGLDNFKYMFQLPNSSQVFINTLAIAIMKIVFGTIAAILFALLLNEVRLLNFKRWTQTLIYLPHFMSWVILSGILIDMLSLDGIVNQVVKLFGGQPIMFLASNNWFRTIVVGSNVWKEFGFGTIVYLAALTGINPSLYESAGMDGATRWQQLIYITIPGIAPTIVLMGTLDLGHILNAGFDQIFNLYNPLVYTSGDIIDTYVYRIGLVQMQFGLATAVGLLKSVVAIIMIFISYRLAYKLANYRVF